MISKNFDDVRARAKKHKHPTRGLYYEWEQVAGLRPKLQTNPW